MASTKMTGNVTIPATVTGEFSALAVALDIAMACDESAQARYLAIYGVAYEPVVTFADRAANSTAPTTTAHTVK